VTAAVTALAENVTAAITTHYKEEEEEEEEEREREEEEEEEAERERGRERREEEEEEVNEEEEGEEEEEEGEGKEVKSQDGPGQKFGSPPGYSFVVLGFVILTASYTCSDS
jgi:hypothetical protein